MRIWHQNLIQRLCQKHLCAMWREGIIMYYGIIENKKSWKNHPARKEFENCPEGLWNRLNQVRIEMLKRGYNPQQMPKKEYVGGKIKEWQTFEKQIKILKQKKSNIKNCNCQI